MKQDEFDLRLMDEMGELPPQPLDAPGFTPWRAAMSKILWGMGLTTFTFQFFYLQYLLPLLGTVLMYLGYRSLRRENRWFGLCWVLSGARMGWHILFNILNATPLMQLFADSAYNFPLSLALCGVQTLTLFALRAGIRSAFASTGEGKPRDWLGRGLVCHLAALAIAVWSELVPLTQPSIFGLDIIDRWQYLYYGRGVAFIALEIYLLVCITRQSDELALRGYDITPVPVRFSARAVLLAVFGFVLLTLPVVNYVSCHIPTGPAQEVTLPLSGDRGPIRDRLLSLGMPEELVDCLDEEELKTCQSAVAAQMLYWSDPDQTDEERTYREGDLIINDLADARTAITAWMVLLPDNQVRYYYYFRYLSMPGLRLQEQFSADPIGNYPTHSYAGRLVWEEAGRTYTCRPEVHLAGGQTAEELEELATAIMFPELVKMEIERLGGHLHYSPWFNFSIPTQATAMRGYLAYSADLEEYDVYDSAVIALRHQNRFFQYPFCDISAMGGGRSLNYGTITSVGELFMLYGDLPY